MRSKTSYKLKAFLLWAFFIAAAHGSSAAQHIVLNVIGDTMPHKFYLLAYQTDRYYLKDSTLAKTGADVSFTVTEPTARMYMITSPNFIKEIELIVSSAEKEIHLSGTIADLNNGNYHFFGSTENYCWQAILNAQKEFEAQSGNYVTAKYSLDKFDPYTNRKYNAADSLLNAAILNYDKELTRLSVSFSGTFCGSVIAINAVLPTRYMKEEWKEAFDNDNAFWHQHYFDFINFQDSRNLNSPLLRKSLDAYLNTYTYPNSKGQKYFIDLLFSKPMADDVKRFLSGLYLQTFASMNSGELVQYIMDKEGDICNDGDGSPTLMKYLSQLQAGSAAPEIMLNDLTGKKQVLSAIDKDKKFTVLVFYSPGCPHCIDFLRNLDWVYKKNETLFNVFTITDSKPEEVKLFNEKNGYNWISAIANTSDSLAKAAYNNYAVIGSPTIVLIDDKMKIISRFGDIDRIKELVARY